MVSGRAGPATSSLDANSRVGKGPAGRGQEVIYHGKHSLFYSPRSEEQQSNDQTKGTGAASAEDSSLLRTSLTMTQLVSNALQSAQITLHGGACQSRVPRVSVRGVRAV